jgi:hypothetical protein
MINEHDLLSQDWITVAKKSASFNTEFSLQQWWISQNTLSYQTPAALALYAGLNADRLASAFACGYQAALRHLFPSLGTQVGAFCVTEATGAHPRQIQTTLNKTTQGWQLSGDKSFVSMADLAQQAFVIALRGEQDGRPDLALVQVAISQTHCKLSKPLSYIPELCHGALTIDTSITSASILPGDGHSDYSKVFRILEDIYVSIAVLSMLLSNSVKSQHENEFISDVLSCIQQLISLTKHTIKNPHTHLLLASTLRQSTQLYQQVNHQLSLKGNSTTGNSFWIACWERDKPLLGFAKKSRDQRFFAACKTGELSI